MTLEQVYRGSFVLKEFFNIYFMAALNNCFEVINYLYHDLELAYPKNSTQISPLEIGLLNNYTQMIKKLLKIKAELKDFYLREIELYELFIQKDI